MSSVITATSTFAESPQTRLEEYLARHGGAKRPVEPLTPDASTRVYFRVPWKRGTAVAAVYPDAFDETVQPYLDVTRLFIECKLPVPEIYDVDGSLGVIVQEDLGDNQLCKVFEDASEDDRESLMEEAIEIIARIQAATAKAIERDSIASRLAFDEPKLGWELNFFFEHYFGSYRKETLTHGQAAELKVELNDIAADLAARPRVLCHRDYHSFNLILDKKHKIRIIDYQDARMGPATYDLVSLLLDRVRCAPSPAEVRAHRLFLLHAREELKLPSIDPDEFSKEFRLMTVQRCLKAVGTFSYQTGVRGRKDPYEQFIDPLLLIVSHAAEWLDRFPVLQRMIKERI